MTRKRITGQTIRKKAFANELEVEHLLRAAHSPSTSLADELDELARELDWRFEAEFPEVPWRKWVFVVSEYCRGGFAGLVQLANDKQYVRFVCGLLEELRGDEALQCLPQIAGDLIEHPGRDLETSVQIASSINLICLSKQTVNPNSIDAGKIRKFLHQTLQCATSDAQLGTLLCALRFYGNEQSLARIENVRSLPEHWESARLASKRAILKRLKAGRN